MPAANKTSHYAVLVVEDETLLRLHAIDIVEEAGFIPIEAKNADEAIVILEKRSDIALLLTDVHMPGSMDGLKLAHAVRGRWPPIKIIVVSGHIRLDEQQMPSGSRFFAKPFSAERMVGEMRKQLAAYAAGQHP